MTATSLYDLAKELLDFCVVALDELAAGAPARRYVAFGLPALDCEQLTTHVFQVGEAAGADPAGTPMDRFRHGAPYPRLNLAFIVITCVRDCVPGPTGNSTAPSVADLDGSAQELYADGWQLWNAVPQGIRDGALFDGCRFVAWEPMQPLGPEGYIAGWTMPLQVELPGYVPPAPV